MAWGKNSRRRKELPKDWDRIRRTVLRRDGGLCVFCGNPANQVDHIIPDGPHVPDNLRALCHHCHMVRTQQQSAEARKRRYNRGNKARGPRPKSKHPGYL
nr:MAG TPA: HNH endonuclease [Caudoviricetes sp.]